MQPGECNQTIFIGSQSAVGQASGGAGSFGNMGRIGEGNGFPCNTVRRPFQQELCPFQGFALLVDLQNGDLTGFQTIGKVNLCGLARSDGHGLGILAFAPIQRIFLDDLLHHIFAGQQIIGRDRTVCSCGIGSNQLVVAGTVHLEDPSCNRSAVGHGFDDLAFSVLGIREGYTLDFTCSQGYSFYRGVINPIRMLFGFVHLSDVVSTGQQLDFDLAGTIGCEGRSINGLGTGRIGIDVEFPSIQIFACVGRFDDFGIAVVGIVYRDGCGIAICDFHGLHAIIRNPEIGASAQLLYIVGAGDKTVHRHSTVGSGGEGRTGNGLGTGRIRIHAETPAGQILAGVGGFLDLQTAGYQLIHRLDGDGHIGCILGQGHSPGGFSAGFVAIGERRFHHLVSTQRQLAGLRIAAGIGRPDGVLVTGFLIGSSKAGSCKGFAAGITFLHFNVAGVIFHVVHIQMVPGHRSGGLGAGVGHILHGADLRATGVANMDDEVVLAPVGAAGGIHIVGTGIDGNMGQLPILGEYDHIAGYQIGIGGGCAGVLGHTGAGLGSQGIQCVLPDRYAGQVVHIVIPVICTCLLDLVVDHAGIHTFDIGKVVTQVIGDEGSADQTVLLEEGDIWRSAGCGTGFRHGLVAVGTLTA